MKSFVSLVLFAAMLSLAPRGAKADQSEEWMKKAARATTEVARGNPQGAAYQMAPRATAQLPAHAQVVAGPGGAGVRQPIAHVQAGPVQVSGYYNAYTTNLGLGRQGKPGVAQNVQVGAAAPYVSNTTVFTPPAVRPKKKESAPA
ncbi:MAG TPA: hypothetical protein VL688_07165 [Verrucomicrobiae bacterium]|jgi:hypothetical protein|nr:hypothetical protein [Verrucomicrobiae bacterium]